MNKTIITIINFPENIAREFYALIKHTLPLTWCKYWRVSVTFNTDDAWRTSKPLLEDVPTIKHVT